MKNQTKQELKRRKRIYLVLFSAAVIVFNAVLFQVLYVNAVISSTVSVFFEWQIGNGCSDVYLDCDFDSRTAQLNGVTRSSYAPTNDNEDGYADSGTYNVPNTSAIRGDCSENDSHLDILLTKYRA